ncbi:hypothetical protein V6N13_059095 [Hibiscus sabdariffa]
MMSYSGLLPLLVQNGFLTVAPSIRYLRGLLSFEDGKPKFYKGPKRAKKPKVLIRGEGQDRVSRNLHPNSPPPVIRHDQSPLRVNSPSNMQINEPGVKKDTRPPKKQTNKTTFTHLPISYTELYAHLNKADLVWPYIVAHFRPPYPAWYDEKARCDYHGGVPEHSIKNCTAFKKVAQNLIKVGALKFDNPNVAANPLPNHGGRGVNVIGGEADSGEGKIVDQSDI